MDARHHHQHYCKHEPGATLSSGPGATCDDISTIKPAQITGNQTQRDRKGLLIDHLIRRKVEPKPCTNVANLAKNHQPFLGQLNLMKKLPVHDGCVNTICWNKTGEYILSGSDDRNLCITKPNYLFDTSNGYQVVNKISTNHLGNIFSAKFLPNSNDHIIASCSSNGPIIVHDIKSVDPGQGVFHFNCHSSTIFDVVPFEDDDRVFLSCGEDKTVRLFDLRCHRSCSRAGTCPHPAYIRNSHAVTTLAIHPTNSNFILVGRGDGRGLVYDRRKLPDTRSFSREKAHLERLNGTESSPSSCRSITSYRHPLEGAVSQFVVSDLKKSCRITSLCYSQNGEQVLASYFQDYVYLFNHDKSSNFELAQKISPRSTLPSRSDITNSDTIPMTRSTIDNNSNSESQNSNPSRPIRRYPTLRVRGDWSDTGVDSTPRNHLSSSGNGSSIEDDNEYLETLTDRAIRLFVGRNRVARGAPLAEILAGPIRLRNSGGVGSSNNRRSVDSRMPRASGADNNQQSMPHRSRLEPMQQNDEELEEEVDANSNSMTSNQDQTTNITTEDDSEDGSDNDDDDDGDDDDEEDGQADQEDSRSKQRAKRHESRISPESKLKFQKFSERLKSKHSQIEVYCPEVIYQGHRNSKTTIKQAKFWGDDYIISGSDCGRIFFWEKATAKIVMAFKADNHVVNCLEPNPHHYALASSGIDYDIKLWSTQNLLDGPMKISQDDINKIVRNNELMLEEARSTITVPPHLFFRFLATISQDPEHMPPRRS